MNSKHHNYLHDHYKIPESADASSRFRFIKNLIARCLAHFTHAQNELNVNLVRTLDEQHQMIQANMNIITKQQEQIDLLTLKTRQIESKQLHFSEMQNHHGAIINLNNQDLINLENDVLDFKKISNRHFDQLINFENNIIELKSSIQSIMKPAIEQIRKYEHRTDHALITHNDKIATIEATVHESISAIEQMRKYEHRADLALIAHNDKIATIEAMAHGSISSIDTLSGVINELNIQMPQLIKNHVALEINNESFAKAINKLAEADQVITCQSNDLAADIKVLSDILNKISRRVETDEKGFTALNKITNDLIKRSGRLHNSLELLVNTFKNNPQNTVELIENALATQKLINNDKYLAFENANRGTIAQIKERLSFYLPFINVYKTSATNFVFDIGCGRGEFLQLLKENNITAKGVDINQMAISTCQETGLDAENDDLFVALEKIEPHSLPVISAFHLIEHLSYEALEKFINLAFAKLQEHGILILETPNPLNLRVGACEFYRDPTHVRPVHPVTLEHTLIQAGFDSLKTEFLHPYGPQDSLVIKDKSFSVATQDNFTYINKLISGCRDYAIIATKKDLL